MNKVALNSGGSLNGVMLNSEKRVSRRNQNEPWKEYVQDGLLFMIDCENGISGTTWKDIIDRTRSATISGTYTQTDGVVLASGASVTFPSVSDVAYVEICLKETDGEFETTTATSLETYSTAGSLYSVRAYSRELSTTEQAQNSEIDQNRWNIPDGALYDVDGNVVIDSNGNYIIMQ